MIFESRGNAEIYLLLRAFVAKEILIRYVFLFVRFQKQAHM